MAIDSPFGPRSEQDVTEPRVPHSGDVGLEFPEKKYDESLLEAHVDGLIDPIPDALDEPASDTEPTPVVLTEPQVTETVAAPTKKLSGKKIGAIVAGAAVVIGGGIFALTGGGSSEKSSRQSAEPSEQPADPSFGEDKEPPQSAGEGMPLSSEFLATVEKSPEEAVKAHIMLENLVETTLTDQKLLPYLYYDTNVATNPKLKEYMDVINEVVRLRGSIGPVGSYVNPEDIQTTATRTPEGNLVSDNVVTVHLVDWDNDNKQFVEKTIQYTNRKELRKKIVNGMSVWVLYGHEGSGEPQTLETNEISNQEASKRLKEAAKTADAILKGLGLNDQ